MNDNLSLKILEEKRTQLIKIATKRGINDPSVIEMSKELDQLITIIQKKNLYIRSS